MVSYWGWVLVQTVIACGPVNSERESDENFINHIWSGGAQPQFFNNSCMAMMLTDFIFFYPI